MFLTLEEYLVMNRRGRSVGFVQQHFQKIFHKHTVFYGKFVAGYLFQQALYYISDFLIITSGRKTVKTRYK